MSIKPIQYILVLAVLLLTACDGTVYYSEYGDVDENGWKSTDSVCFDVQVDDTTHLFNLLAEVRNNVDYPYSNLFLFVNLTLPDGSVAPCDTLEIPLADAMGKWQGKHSGRYVDSRFRLNQKERPIRFPMMGNYHFAITNGMRDDAINGISHVGLIVEYSNAK